MRVRVDWRSSCSIVGSVLVWLAVPLLAPLALAVSGGSDVVPFLDATRVGLVVTEFEAMGAAAATFFNVGPGFGVAGPFASYEVFPTTTKLLMVVLMWVGRIEIIPVLVLLKPSFWRV